MQRPPPHTHTHTHTHTYTHTSTHPHPKSGPATWLSAGDVNCWLWGKRPAHLPGEDHLCISTLQKQCVRLCRCHALLPLAAAADAVPELGDAFPAAFPRRVHASTPSWIHTATAALLWLADRWCGRPKDCAAVRGAILAPCSAHPPTQCRRILTTSWDGPVFFACPMACLPFGCAARVPVLSIPTGAPPTVPSSACQRF